MRHTEAEKTRFTILYVEDETEIREMVSEAIADEYPEAAVHMAADGAEGLVLFRAHRPEVVVTDIRMPVMDGLRMAVEMKSLDPAVSIIALTAYSDTDYLLNALRIGFSGYVLKPIEFETLFEAMNQVIDIIRMKRQIDRQNEQIRQFAAELEITVAERTKELEHRSAKLREITLDLKVARDRYWNLYNWSPLGYLSLDENYTIREINITAAQMLGGRRRDLVGTSLERYLSPENIDLLAESYRRCVEETVVQAELQLRLENRYLYVQLHCAPYMDVAANRHLYRTAIIDITKRKETEEALHRETEEKLKAVEELRAHERLMIQQNRQAAMGEMLGNIAHQWRQPLNVVALLLQNLLIEYDQGRLSRESVENNVRKGMEKILHMSQTIDDFRRFLAPEAEKSTFDVNAVTKKAVDIIQESLREAEIQMQESPGPVTVLGQRNQYVQAVINIVLNAREALQERGTAHPRISIKVTQMEGKGFITIADNAGGIPADIIDRIFDPYFTTKDPDRGTGIGLFMSKTIIEKMGGQLTVRNTGDGAEFILELPEFVEDR